MRIDIPDFDKVETGREPVEDGRYTVQMHACNKEATVDKTGEKIACEGIITGPKHAKKHLWWSCSLKPQALWNLKSMLAAAGVPFTKDGFSTEDVLGKALDVQVGHKEYDGKIYNRIDGFYPATKS